jgi:hypothetical protein
MHYAVSPRHVAFCPVGTGGKAGGAWICHSPPSSTEVCSGWRFAPTPLRASVAPESQGGQTDRVLFGWEWEGARGMRLKYVIILKNTHTRCTHYCAVAVKKSWYAFRCHVLLYLMKRGFQFCARRQSQQQCVFHLAEASNMTTNRLYSLGSERQWSKNYQLSFLSLLLCLCVYSFFSLSVFIFPSIRLSTFLCLSAFL